MDQDAYRSNDRESEGYRRIVAHRFGDPDVLGMEWAPVRPAPGEHEARIRIEAAGVGYTDTILRRGKYVDYKGGLPLTPGYDIVGVVDALGSAVSDLTVGQRVADMPVHGGYAGYIVRPARDLVPVPVGIPASAAVEVPLMWMTAWQMLTRSLELRTGQAILVVGASGSVGRALVTLGRHLSLRVIGTCSSGRLAEVEALGATALDYRRSDLIAAVREATGGKGVAAAFDAVGGRSWDASWACLGGQGVLVGYGLQGYLDENGSTLSAIASFARLLGLRKLTGTLDGSRRRTAFSNIQKRRAAQPDDYRQDARTLFGLLATGQLAVPPAEILPLDQAAEAHRRVAHGGLTRRLVLHPEL